MAAIRGSTSTGAIAYGLIGAKASRQAEPEAALSVTGALALLAIIVRAASAGGQFVIATHSPILLACPGARIYELDQNGVSQQTYDDLETVRLTRGFLDAPERYLHAALDELDDA